MRQTYTSLKTMFLNGTQNTGNSDATLLAFFQQHLGIRYQETLAVIMNHQTIIPRTMTTVAEQQFYHNPPGVVFIDSATISIGGVAYPLDIIHSEKVWQRLNEVLITVSAIPCLIFPRRDDFGIYPIPTGAHTVTLNSNLRDRIMTQDDYTTGTIAVTNGDETITVSGGTFTQNMVGRWFKNNNNGYWYRIASYTNSTSMELETKYIGSTESGATYVIGESPELPEEAHEFLATGVISDYFGLIRSDIEKATWFNNIYWTGDGNNKERENMIFSSGILGVRDRYSGRDNSGLVKRRPYGETYQDREWAETISSS